MNDKKQQSATHFAVPVDVFQTTIKTLETLPYGQVSPLMAALSKCGALHISPDKQPGDLVDELDPPGKDTPGED